MVLKAIIHKADEGGYWADFPALSGCVTQGESEKEVTENLREAIEGWLLIETQESDRVIELAV
jgi:predicted RNase H-like HicB family nuclease